jgi:hypothetical protein
MSVPLRLSVISRLAGAAAVISMYGTGSAWAGDGGDSGVSVYGVFLSFVSLFPQITSPPVFPTGPNDPVTPIILESAALTNYSPDVVRIINTVCEPGGSAAPGGSGLPFCSQIAIDAVNQPAKSLPEDFTDAIRQATPLAFISNQGTLSVTQYGDPAANSFLYAYAAASRGTGQPDTAVFVFDYLPGKSNQIASISFQMAVLDSGSSERSVTATLTCPLALAQNNQGQDQGQDQGGNAAACAGGTVRGDFVTPGVPKSYSPAQLGLRVGSTLGSSPNSSSPHTMLQVLVPLLVNPTTDPAYFESSPCPTGINPFSGHCVAFSSPGVRFTPAFLGKPAGISPLAALGPVPATPPGAPPGPPIVASFSGKPAVSAFFAIATSGVTLVSTPVSSAAD